MVSRVIVRIMGAVGVDDVDRLLGDLMKETALEWREERSPDGKHLGAAVDTVLLAVMGGAVGKGTEMVVDRAREVVGRWRDRRLDPPDAEVCTQDVPEQQPGHEIPGSPEATDAED